MQVSGPALDSHSVNVGADCEQGSAHQNVCAHCTGQPSESGLSVSEQDPPISANGAKRRSTRIVHTVPLLVTWVDGEARTIAEETATVSVNCHGFRYFSKQRPRINTSVTIQPIGDREGNAAICPPYAGRVAWVRKSQRLDGLYLVGVELGIPSNIWNVDEVPDDWAAFSPPREENPVSFLAEVDRMLHSTRTQTFYQLLNVDPGASRSEVKRHFYQLAGRYHPDHHMGHPEWTPRLLTLMEVLTMAYKTLSDDATKKEYDLLLARDSAGASSYSRRLAQGYLEKAQECMAEKNFSGSILWLHRAIESEPGCSSHRATLGRCLSAVPEYRREAGSSQCGRAFRLWGVAGNLESALAGALPLSARFGAGRQSSGSAGTFEPAGCGCAEGLVETISVGAVDQAAVRSDWRDI